MAAAAAAAVLAAAGAVSLLAVGAGANSVELPGGAGAAGVGGAGKYGFNDDVETPASFQPFVAGNWTVPYSNPALWTFEGFDYEMEHPPEAMEHNRHSYKVQGCLSEWLRCLARVSYLEPVCAVDVYTSYWEGFYSVCELEYQNCWFIRHFYQRFGFKSDYRQTKKIYDGLGADCHFARWWRFSGYRRAMSALKELVWPAADTSGTPPDEPAP